MPFDLSKLGYWLHTSEKYMVGFLGISLWDSVATLPAEYRLIWKDRKWQPMKIAYLINKYWNVMNTLTVIPMVYGNVSNARCGNIYWLLTVLVTFGTLVCDVIVGIRVYALYECKKYMLILLSILVAAEAGLMARTGSRLIPLSLPPLLADNFDYHGCTPINPVKNEKLNAVLYWAPSLLYNLQCLSLLVGRHVYLARKFKSTSILERLTRDGIIYFCVIVAVDVTSLYFSAQNNPGLTNINVYTSAVLKSLMCTRLILGLRERGASSKPPLRPVQVKIQPPTEEPLAPWIPPHLLHLQDQSPTNESSKIVESRVPLHRTETRAAT